MLTETHHASDHEQTKQTQQSNDHKQTKQTQQSNVIIFFHLFTILICKTGAAPKTSLFGLNLTGLLTY